MDNLSLPIDSTKRAQGDLTRFPLEPNWQAGGVGTALGGHGGHDDGVEMVVISSGEMMRQGWVLLVSRPLVGSRRTRTTSNLEATTFSLSPTETLMAHHDR